MAFAVRLLTTGDPFDPQASELVEALMASGWIDGVGDRDDRRAVRLTAAIKGLTSSYMRQPRHEERRIEPQAGQPAVGTYLHSELAVTEPHPMAGHCVKPSGGPEGNRRLSAAWTVALKRCRRLALGFAALQYQR